MKSRTLLAAGGAVLLMGAGALLLPRSNEAQPSIENPRTSTATARVAKSNDRSPVTPPKEAAEPVENDRGLPDEERAAILTAIEQASVTYDSNALPLIEPYLTHPDGEVRLAAMNGMVVLGEAAAGPLLRKAAESAPTPKEAVALAEAASFVELPSGTFVHKNRTSPGIRKPLQAKPAERPGLRHLPSAKAKKDSSSPVE